MPVTAWVGLGVSHVIRSFFAYWLFSPFVLGVLGVRTSAGISIKFNTINWVGVDDSDDDDDDEEDDDDGDNGDVTTIMKTTTITIMTVARNLCAGRPAGRAPETPVSGGSGGMLPRKMLKFRSPDMPFPEAISSSYLIQVMIFQR